MKTTALLILALLVVSAMAAERPVYRDCRASEDIVHGRTVHRTVCESENGHWIEVQPEKKKAPQALAPTSLKPGTKPVYHDCRPSEDLVKGRAVHKAECQNQDGAWVELWP